MSDAIQQFTFAVDLLRAQLWQFDNQKAFTTLMQGENDYWQTNQNEFWSNWYRDVFDLRTANDFGLAVWAQILCLPLGVTVDPTPMDVVPWGFGDFNENFDNGNFAVSATEIQSLTTDQKRLVLRMRFLQIISRGTIPEINEVLALLKDDYGLAYAIDGEDMTITIVFTFAPPQQLQFVFDNFDLIPRPSAVKLNFLVNPQPAWGFGDFNENFYDSNFAPTN